jgi:hypothetical protein
MKGYEKMSVKTFSQTGRIHCTNQKENEDSRKVMPWNTMYGIRK